MSSLPKVSVLTCFHNERPNHLRSCIESVLNEGYPEVELILVNDASKNSAAVEEVIDLKDPRIIYMRNEENLGLTRSLNVGLKKATGEFVARLDSNDFNVNSRLRKQAEFLMAHPEIGLCGSAYQELLDDQVITPRVELLEEDTSIRKKFSSFNPFAHSTLMFRRKLLEEAGGYDPFYYFSQDYDLTYRLLKKTKAANLSEVLVKRHISSLDISRKNYKKQLYFATLIRLRSILVPLAFNPKAVLVVAKNLVILLTPAPVVRVYKKIRYGYV